MSRLWNIADSEVPSSAPSEPDTPHYNEPRLSYYPVISVPPASLSGALHLPWPLRKALSQ